MKNYIHKRWAIEQRQFPSLQIISWLIIANISILWLAQINHFYILLLPLNAICLIYKRFIALVLLVAAILVNFQLQIYALNSDWVTESQAMDEMRVKVTALSRQSEYGFVTTVHNLANDRNYIAYSESALPLHGKCQISGKLQPHKLQATPSQFDQYQYYVANHIVGRIQLDSINCNTAFSLRSSLLRKLQERQLAQPAQAMATALLFGEKYNFTAKQLHDLSNAQIMHLFVISGAHIGFVMLLVLLLLKPIKWLALLVGTSGVSRWGETAILLGTILLYAYLAGANVPVIRALIAAIMYLLLWQRFNLTARHTLLLLAAIMLLVDPFKLIDISFILSFLMVWAMLWLHAGVQQPTHRHYAAIAVKLWLFSSLLAMTFHLPINLFGVISNTLFALIVSLLLIPLSFAALLPIDSIAWLLNEVSLVTFWLAEWFARFSLSLPSLPVLLFSLFWLLLFGIDKLAPKLWPIPFMLMISLAIFKPTIAENTLRLINFDVGQGQSTLIQSNEVWLLYDMGFAQHHYARNVQLITSYMRQTQLAENLIYVVSHSDRDHSGGFAGVVQAIPATKILTGQPLDSAFSQIGAESCHGQSLSYGQLKMDFLPHSSFRGFVLNSDNDQSCVALLRWKNVAILLVGDISKLREYQILAEHSLPQLDVLQLGHHGSRSSSSDLWLQTLAPDIVINSSGQFNRFGHPHANVVDKLSARGIQLLDTQQCGHTELIFGDGGMQIKCQPVPTWLINNPFKALLAQF